MPLFRSRDPRSPARPRCVVPELLTRIPGASNNAYQTASNDVRTAGPDASWRVTRRKIRRRTSVAFLLIHPDRYRVDDSPVGSR